MGDSRPMTIDERLARQRQGGTAQASATPRRGSGDKRR